MKVEPRMWVRVGSTRPKQYPVKIERWFSQKSIDDMLEMHPELILKASHDIADLLEIGDELRFESRSGTSGFIYRRQIVEQEDVEFFRNCTNPKNITVLTREQYNHYATRVVIE